MSASKLNYSWAIFFIHRAIGMSVIREIQFHVDVCRLTLNDIKLITHHKVRPRH